MIFLMVVDHWLAGVVCVPLFVGCLLCVVGGFVSVV